MGMSEEDAQEIIDEFDKNGDGVLSIEEFAEAFDMFMLDEDDFEPPSDDAAPDLEAEGGDNVGGTVPPASTDPLPASNSVPTAPPFVYKGYPTSGPGFAMFSPQSFGCLSTKAESLVGACSSSTSISNLASCNILKATVESRSSTSRAVP